jgi:thioesterase domain-containing protein
MSALEKQRDQVNYAAAAEYLPHMRSFPDAVTLIGSGVRLRNDPLKSPTGRWSELIATLDVASVDADHFGILRDEPHVSELAAILSDRLRRVGRPFPRRSEAAHARPELR